MAFDSYQRQPDGTITFTDPNGQTLNAAGAAAEQKAMGIDASRRTFTGGGPSEFTKPATGPIAQPNAFDQAMLSGDSRIADMKSGGRGKLAASSLSIMSPEAAPRGFEEAPATSAVSAQDQVEEPARTTFGGPGKADMQGATDVLARPGHEGAVNAPAGGKIDPSTVHFARSGGNGDPGATAGAAGRGGGGGGGFKEPAWLTQQKMALATEGKANAMMLESQYKQAQEIAAEKERLAQEAEDRHWQTQINEYHRQEALKAKTDELDKLSDDLGKEKIDSGRFWASKDNSDRFLGAIAMGMGAFAQGMGAGPNMAAQILDRAIDRDIEEQRANIENKRSNLKAKESMFARYREVLGDDRAAEAAAKAEMYKRAADKIDSVIADNAPDQVRAQGEATRSALMGKMAALQLQVAKAAQASAGSASVGWSKGTIYPNDREFAAGYGRALKENPNLTIEGFKRASMSSGGAGKVNSKGPIALGLVKEQQFQTDAQMVAESYGLKRGANGEWQVPSYGAAKAEQASNALGDLVGTEGSTRRQNTRTAATGAFASILKGGGTPDETSMKEAQHLFNSNDPRAIAVALNTAERSGKAFAKAGRNMLAGDTGSEEEPEPTGKGGKVDSFREAGEE